MGNDYEYSEDNLPEKKYRREKRAKYTDKELVEAYKKHGSFRKAANALGLSFESVRRRVNRHKIDPAVKAGMDAVNTDIEPSVLWAKTHKDGTTTYSALLNPKSKSTAQILEAIEQRFEHLKPIKAIKPDAVANSDLMTVYPIFDAHIGMRAWGEEVGEDYDSDIAVRYITKGITECVEGSPASDTAIIINGGDMMHADDNNNQTPKSKHALDVDSRHFKTIDTVIALSAALIEIAAKKHRKVIYRALRGNHDEHSHIALTMALYQRYRNSDNIVIEKAPSDFFVHRFGKVMVAAHHGDKGSATNLVLQAADKWPEMWGQTRHRYYYIGHKHHKEFKDIGGMSCEMLRAATKPDSYSDSHSFTGKSQLRAITYHREKGECARKIVNY